MTKEEIHYDPNDSDEKMKERPENEEIVFESNSVTQSRDWAMKKIELLHEADRHKNARALESEFSEWIHIAPEVEEIDYLCIEDDSWTDEQEIDVR